MNPENKAIPPIEHSHTAIPGHQATRWEMGLKGNVVSLYFDSWQNMEAFMESIRVKQAEGGDAQFRVVP
jgi:hypothetical protein